MPQTTDLHAAIMNLPCKPPALTASAEVWAYQYGHRDARHAAAELVSAVPLVAEAPREPVATMYVGQQATRDGFRIVWHKQMPDGEHALYAAPPVSLAPMPEEWQQETMRLVHDYCAQRISTAALLSHLRTAPLALPSDEQWRNDLSRLSNYALGAVTWADDLEAAAKRVRAALLASVAPQPEQPNTEQPHLADNGRKPVQGLDAAAGVALPVAASHWPILYAILRPAITTGNQAVRHHAERLAEVLEGEQRTALRKLLDCEPQSEPPTRVVHAGVDTSRVDQPKGGA